MYDGLISKLREDAEFLKISSRYNNIKNEFAERISEAADVIEKLSGERKKGKWIPVTERLPKEGQIVCVSDGRNTWDYGQFRGTLKPDVTIWHWKGRSIKTVKWWMPKSDALPEPPKEE